MKKLIIKSSIITAVLILVVTTAFLFVLSLLKPNVIANMAFNLNNERTCVKYSEKQYLKTKDINDLALLTERCIWAGDDKSVVKYSTILLSHNDFESLNKGSNYENYIASSCTESLYKIGNKLKSVEIAFSYYDGITTPNAVRVLIYNSQNDKDTLNLILQKLNGLQNQTLETENLKNEINKLI